jgi:hypothetical protein
MLNITGRGIFIKRFVVMYIFQIIKPKYNRLTRVILKLLVFIVLMGFLFLSFGIVLTVANFSIAILVFIIIVLIYSIFLENFIRKKIIEKYSVIGKMEFNEEKLNIATKQTKKEILFAEINEIKLVVGMGYEGKGALINFHDTYLTSIILKDKTIFNIHITRNCFDTNITQEKPIWNKDVDLFDLLRRKEIKYMIFESLEFKRPIKKESECLQD